jgi:hypothetical protein
LLDVKFRLPPDAAHRIPVQLKILRLFTAVQPSEIVGELRRSIVGCTIQIRSETASSAHWQAGADDDVLALFNFISPSTEGRPESRKADVKPEKG